MPDIWGVASIVTKFALYIGVLTAAGTVMAALLFRLTRYRKFAATFAVIGLLATVLAFSLRGAMLTGDAAGMIDPKMLGLLWTTPVGTAFAFRMVGLALVIIGLFVGKFGHWVSVVGGILAIWSFVQIGHIPDHDTTLLKIALTLHLIAVAIWIGILSPLKRLAATRDTWPSAADVGHKFGMLASITVPLLIVAGVYMSYELVGSISALISTSYGQALIFKVVIVVMLLVLAAANKLRFIPKLKEGDPNAAGHLVKSITVEWLMILLILGITAILTSTLTLPK